MLEIAAVTGGDGSSSSRSALHRCAARSAGSAPKSSAVQRTSARPAFALLSPARRACSSACSACRAASANRQSVRETIASRLHACERPRSSPSAPNTRTASVATAARSSSWPRWIRMRAARSRRAYHSWRRSPAAAARAMASSVAAVAVARSPIRQRATPSSRRIAGRSSPSPASASARSRRFAAAGMSSRPKARRPAAASRCAARLRGRAVVDPELGPAAVRLLEVVARQLVLVPVGGEPVREALVQRGAQHLRDLRVGDVADQRMPEAEAVVARDRRLLRRDELLAHEREQRASHRGALLGGREIGDRPARELAPGDRGALEQPALERVELVEPRGEQRLDRRAERRRAPSRRASRPSARRRADSPPPPRRSRRARPGAPATPRTARRAAPAPRPRSAGRG